MKYIAHAKEENKSIVVQTMLEHLTKTSELSKRFATKIGLGLFGEVSGLAHDLAKYCLLYQYYIRSAAGILNPGDEGYVNPKSWKGKIDHSTAGAQMVWESMVNSKKSRQTAQIIALCICSHHGGLIDCLDSTGEPNYLRRINKEKEKTYFDEAMRVVKENDPEVLNKICEILDSEELKESYKNIIDKVKCKDRRIMMFFMGLLIRFLYSCLIDADRIDTADFMCGENSDFRQCGGYVEWDTLIEKLEKKLSKFNSDTPVKQIRQDISKQCLEKARSERGVFSLTVPTGGGKTLASLRFALHHAKEHGLERIIYVIPYLTILDQNAKTVKDIFEEGIPEREKGKIVLEYHSNLIYESKNEDDEERRIRQEVLSQNLDAPVIFTTSVHILEVLFGGSTSASRQFHQLANSMIIFDEIQTLPVKCAHLFCNAMNFLVEMCGSSVMLCTATMPVLNNIDEKKGRLNLDSKNEIISDVKGLFDKLKRVEFTDSRKTGGWEIGEVAQATYENALEHGSCLTIVNTKSVAQRIYQSLQDIPDLSECAVFHLSTNMCPKHRMKVLSKMREKLDARREGRSDLSVICVSTQLVEAGIDVDFATVMRSAAGLDSIAQAAGRCNRNGLLDKGDVFVINPQGENIDKLEDIRIGREQAIRILDYVQEGAFQEIFEEEEADILSPEIMKQYFEYYFHKRSAEMVYNIPKNAIKGVPEDDLLNLLSENQKAACEYVKLLCGKGVEFSFMQAFGTAGKTFKPIEDNTRGIIVPYRGARDESGSQDELNGEDIIAELCSVDDVKRQKELLKKAQQYAVNVFDQEFHELCEKGAIYEVQEGVGIYALKEQYYSDKFGLCKEKASTMGLLGF